LGTETKIMGVLNVTPDSFSDGGRFFDPGLAETRALRMEEEGAHLIDVGGESSRPGARAVSSREEIRRIRPVLRRLAGKIKIPISIDTTKYDVAAAALDEGATVVNDICALRGNRRLAKLIARRKAAVVLMHMQGTPATMQKNPIYQKPVEDVIRFLRRAVEDALDAGIDRSRMLVDPGFGFGKTMSHNVALLSHLERFAVLKVPVLAGLSRKSFVGGLTGSPGVDSRLPGSLAAAAVAIQKGAHILRVHDVSEHCQVARLVDGTART
jgi:dihydropteroate synthase